MSFEASSDSFPRRSDALNTDLSYFLDLLISIFEPSGVFHETCDFSFTVAGHLHPT